MARRNALIRTLCDAGPAAWFGGPLPRSVGRGTATMLAGVGAWGGTAQFGARRPPAASGRRAPAYNLFGLLKACHPVPSAAVTALASAYGVSIGVPGKRVALVAATVLAGQLSIGWANDLIDADRDRSTGRPDKPLATGELSISTGRVACGAAVLGTVGLSLGCGRSFCEVYLPCVAAGWSYNLGVKGTVLSWLPYAVAFGGLPVFVALAGGSRPPWWVPASGALLGVGAHLMNVLPDLADDEANGVRGLAHRLGARRTTLLAVASLVAASVLLLIGTRTHPPATVVTVAVVLILAELAIVGEGKTPFHAAIGIAAVDVILLVLAR